MNVNSVMNTYNMGNLWSSFNDNTTSGVDNINNVDSAVQEQYASENYFGGSTSAELQNIFQQIEPTYGIPLTYDKSGNLSIPKESDLPVDGMQSDEENIVSLLQNGSSSPDTTMDENILSQYDSIENGTFDSNLSSILSSNPYNMYDNINSLTSDTNQSTGSFFNSLA